ncbi:MAG: protein kinase, partial [Pirellulaceae bacterium]
MSLLYVCPLGHHWEASDGVPRADTAPATDVSSQACPVCGLAGASSDATCAATATGLLNGETLSPAEIASLVQPLTILNEAARPAPTAPAPGVPSQIGCYEIIRPLGRGGMGVVYLARHVALQRLVALKMIVAGAPDSPELLSRFRLEAEAVARLKHPHVVQIYDVGEEDGQPYLVLEFIDGESLAARIAGKPQPIRLAAEITETLSRAMGYAHRQGIVHRDLKPANILLTPRGDSSSGTAASDSNSHGDPSDLFVPKITDFGLAKRLDAGAGQTRTGELLGTPSYMAPEQATGQAASGEPAVDIYALGVILYELLTGRPPFLGHSPLSTVDQVIRLEPVPPSRLQPRVSRDVDTICLKCLEKDPARRYANADQLADDLRRFLNGEPILARPTSTAVHLWRWSRRRPMTAAAMVLGCAAVLGLVGAGRWHNALLRAERDRAEENFSLAMRAVDEMLTEVGEEQLAYEPHMDQKRRVLLGKALDLCQLFLRQKANDTRVQFETAQAYRRMGDIERWLNNYAQAANAYQQALGILKGLRAQDPANSEYRRWLGYCQNYLGEAYRQLSRTADAEAAYQRAITEEQSLHTQFPHGAM